MSTNCVRCVTNDRTGIDLLCDRCRATDEQTWREYDSAADDMAKRGLKGVEGDPLPNLMSADAVALINDDPEAFQERVRLFAYADAMDGTPEGDTAG